MLYIGETSRECGTCHQIKPYDRFSPRGRRGDTMVYKSTCKECSASRARAWARENAEQHRNTRHARELRETYGISPDDYNEMLSTQGGVCAICGKAETRTHGRTGTEFRLAVDHDHETGRVRGLLCQGCNRGIGLLGDNVERLRKAADYVERGRGYH
jgi:hypothetical protein